MICISRQDYVSIDELGRESLMVSSYDIWKVAVIVHFEGQNLPGKTVRTTRTSAEILTTFYTSRAVTAILHCSVKCHLKRFNPDYITTTAAPQIYIMKYTHKLKVSQNQKYVTETSQARTHEY
jgi:radical SAM superfamily enzyme with C-terminal helix-hairpin-helix motif